MDKLGLATHGKTSLKESVKTQFDLMKNIFLYWSFTGPPNLMVMAITS